MDSSRLVAPQWSRALSCLVVLDFDRRVRHMCFSHDAQPPNLPHHHGDGGQLPPGISVTGGVASAQDVVLTSADGTQFAAYIARPQAPSGAGIVILPDNRGLSAFYKGLAERFATAGVEA